MEASIVHLLRTERNAWNCFCRQLADSSKRVAPADASFASDEEFERLDTLDDEVPLMERLSRLAHAAVSAGGGAELDDARQPVSEPAGPVTADSLVALLTQALRAGDKVLGPHAA